MFVQWNKGSTKSIDCSRDMILFTQNEEVRLWNRSCTLAWTRRFEHFCSRHYVVGGLVCNVKANYANTLNSLLQDSNRACDSSNRLSYPPCTVLDVFIKAFTLLVSKMIEERLEPTILRTPCKCSNHRSYLSSTVLLYS